MGLPQSLILRRFKTSLLRREDEERHFSVRGLAMRKCPLWVEAAVDRLPEGTTALSVSDRAPNVLDWRIADAQLGIDASLPGLCPPAPDGPAGGRMPGGRRGRAGRAPGGGAGCAPGGVPEPRRVEPGVERVRRRLALGGRPPFPSRFAPEEEPAAMRRARDAPSRLRSGDAAEVSSPPARPCRRPRSPPAPPGRRA